MDDKIQMKEVAVSVHTKDPHTIKGLKNSDNNESKKPAIFLDRDGVINKEVNYLSNHNDFEFIDGSIKALQILKKK